MASPNSRANSFTSSSSFCSPDMDSIRRCRSSRPPRPRQTEKSTWSSTPAVVVRYHKPRLLLLPPAAWAPILIFFFLSSSFCTLGAAAAAMPPQAPAPAPAPPAADYAAEQQLLPTSSAPIAAAAAAAASAATGVTATPTLAAPTAAGTGAAADDGADRPPFETLIVDTRVPVLHDGHWTMLSQEQLQLAKDEEEKEREEELRKRQADESSSSSTKTSSSSPATTKSSGSSKSTVKINVSTVTRTASSTANAAASPLPSPLDNSMSANFTASGNSCPIFLNAMLDNPTFKACYPLSVLLQGSKSFFEAEKSLVSITNVLDASCAANVTMCATFLSSVASNLTHPSNCGADFDLGNSVVVTTYLALVSYQTVYAATCLRDQETASYCFANAVTNLTTTANVYFYYLPLNMTVPGSAVPGCSWCLQQSMAIYQASAANRAQPVANTYPGAALLVNTVCGPGFVNETLPAALLLSGASSSLRGGGPSSSLFVVLLTAVFAMVVQLGL